MSSRWIGFFVWALAAASAAFWGVKIFAATRPVPDGAQAPQAIAANGPMERLFGPIVAPTVAAAPVHPESERFQLVGVIAPRAGGADKDGVAIVAIDGQPARPWHVGATLDGSTTLLAVARRTADFGPAGGATAFTLQLPEPSAAVTGTLPPATAQPSPQNNPGVLPAPGVQNPIQRENAQHLAQPQPPGVQRGAAMNLPNRNGMSGRTYPPQNQGNVPPPRTAAPPDANAVPAQGAGDGQQQ